MGLKQFKKNDQYWAINAHQFNLTIYWGSLKSSKKSKTINFESNEDTLVQEQKLILQKINEGYLQFKGAKFKLNPKFQNSKSQNSKSQNSKSQNSKSQNPKSHQLNKKSNSIEIMRTGFAPIDSLLKNKVSTHKKITVKILPGLKMEKILKFQESIRKICKNPKYNLAKEYIEFLSVCGGVKIETESKLFWIFSIKEVIEQTKKFVHVPAGVMWENQDHVNQIITTQHLFCFASSSEKESRWCFDTTRKNKEDIFLFHQDNPLLARSSRTGLPLYKNIKPSSINLKSWLRKYFLK